MPLTFGTVVFLGLLIWALGKGDVKKGAKRFFIFEWGLLGIYLLIFACVIVISFF